MKEITIEDVLAKHAKNYKKTIEENEKSLYHLVLNGFEAINFAKEYASLNRHGWTRVEDGLPDEHEKVLVMFGEENMLMGIMDSNNKWYLFYSDGRNVESSERPVTHWMPLPNKPK